MASFSQDTFEFYLAAVKFYESILESDLVAIDADPDLKVILGERERDTFEIGREKRFVEQLRVWFEEQLEGQHHATHINHGSVRLIKAVSQLYVSHLQNCRDRLASRPRISKHVLDAVDQRIAELQEKTQLGVLRLASPRRLMAQDLPVDDNQPQTHQVPGPSVSDPAQRRPIVLDTIEIFDTDLRKRCLDLLAKFKQDGQYERLDTVVTDATRVLENRLRQLSGAPPTCTGVDLATFCFGGSTPRLVASDVVPEQEAAQLLFRGVFGFIRNGVHHRLVENLQPERVLQLVALVDYLLFVANGAIRKESV